MCTFVYSWLTYKRWCMWAYLYGRGRAMRHEHTIKLALPLTLLLLRANEREFRTVSSWFWLYSVDGNNRRCLYVSNYMINRWTWNIAQLFFLRLFFSSLRFVLVVFWSMCSHHISTILRTLRHIQVHGICTAAKHFLTNFERRCHYAAENRKEKRQEFKQKRQIHHTFQLTLHRFRDIFFAGVTQSAALILPTLSWSDMCCVS